MVTRCLLLNVHKCLSQPLLPLGRLPQFRRRAPVAPHGVKGREPRLCGVGPVLVARQPALAVDKRLYGLDNRLWSPAAPAIARSNRFRYCHRRRHP